MIELAWDEYRGWAKRARTLQAASRRWNDVALGCIVLAAMFAAAASQAPSGSLAARILSFLAAVAAAVTPIVGRDILDVNREARWIRARATAEAIKSECFRYAAGVGDYANPDRDAVFETRLGVLSEPALREGLAPLADPVTSGDTRRPELPMTLPWYLDHRIREQKNTYYARGQLVHERAAACVRALALAIAIAAAVFGAAGSTFGVSWFTPWISVLTTIGATIIAYGALDRHQYLAGSYGAMIVRLSHIEARRDWDLVAVVSAAEDLLQGEHVAWTDRMLKTISVPAAPDKP